MEHSPFEIKRETDEGLVKHLVHHSPPVSTEIEIPSIDGLIRTNFYLGADENFYEKTVVLRHLSFLEFRPQTPQTFHWYKNFLLVQVQNLLTLMINGLVYPTNVQAVYESDGENTKPGMDDIIGIYFPQPRAKPIKRIHYPDMLITMPSIRPRISEAFEAWFSSCGELRSVHELFFGSLYELDAYTDLKFLSLMQALESFHRVTKPGQYLSQDGYEEYRKILVKALPPAMPSDLKDALKARLKYGNEYSLRKRLNEIFESIGTLQSLVCPGSDYQAFVDRVVKCRNYLIHRDESSKPENLDEILVCAGPRLEVLLKILLFRVFTVDEEVIERVIDKITYYSIVEWK